VIASGSLESSSFAMGKKKGKKVDVEKKAALQAKKEAKAEKAARKRLQKQSRTEGGDNDEQQHRDGADKETLDSLIQQYMQCDVTDGVARIEAVEGFPLPRANASLTLVDDEKKKNTSVYMFGGEYYDGVQNIVLDQLYRFDLNKGEWKHIIPAGKVPPARCAHAAIYYNRSLYIFGGELASADEYHHYKDVWRFDTDPNKLCWTEIKPTGGGTFPTSRSGHSTVLWKHYMIVFGGFYEASKDTPRWYNDVTVLDLQTEQWMDVPHSKLALRPEPRSACNVAVLDDTMIVHGGFSKLPRGSGSTQVSEDDDDGNTAAPETKVHTDAWILHLKPLLDGKTPTWERLTSSIPRNQWSTAAAKSPNGRSGTAAITYRQGRMLLFGGVVDKELHHHKVASVFYNDLFVFDSERRKFFPVTIRRKTAGSRRRRKPKDANNTDEQSDEEEKDQDGSDSESTDSDFAIEEEEDVGDSPGTSGWDLDKLRSNMFAFIDGDGNVVYEKIHKEEGEEEIEEKEEEKEEKIDGLDEEQEEKQDDLVESEEEKEESEYDTPAFRGNEVAAPSDNGPPTASTKAISSSSVMTLNPITKKPEAVSRDEPLPRIKASLFLHGHTLYVYGGLLEVGDREVTLDDLWCLDLRKCDHWKCIYAGSMHKQVWRGAVHDDDDSYYSAGAGSMPGESVDLVDADAAELDDDHSGTEEKVKVDPELATLTAMYRLDDIDRTPQPNESLADFFARTSDHWNEQARKSASEELSAKELKREGFGLARKQFEELEPVMEMLQGLGFQCQDDDKAKAEKRSSKSKSKSKKSSK
jgi:N-acetylneuraminic acid mutarotase